ncbi:MarR family transcriptional regulator [bacterium BFN5]|nr:MarR family transcriptional regulator [bacterium BFN5]QJW44869.1 MarR family transcriptional regulator [bacterium BFN5]
MLSPSLEDYLEEIYRLSLSAGTVRVTDISRKLRVSTPSVTKALRRLISKGYITHQRYGLIGVTESGKKMGTFLIERNQTLQEFLMLIRANCDIPAEAESIEHYLSNSTIDSLKSLGLFMQNNPDVYKRYLAFAGVVEPQDVSVAEEKSEATEEDAPEIAEIIVTPSHSDQQETEAISDPSTEPGNEE